MRVSERAPSACTKMLSVHSECVLTIDRTREEVEREEFSDELSVILNGCHLGQFLKIRSNVTFWVTLRQIKYI